MTFLVDIIVLSRCPGLRSLAWSRHFSVVAAVRPTPSRHTLHGGSRRPVAGAVAPPLYTRTFLVDVTVLCRRDHESAVSWSPPVQARRWARSLLLASRRFSEEGRRDREPHLITHQKITPCFSYYTLLIYFYPWR